MKIWLGLSMFQAFVSVEKGFQESIDDCLAEKAKLVMHVPQVMIAYMFLCTPPRLQYIVCLLQGNVFLHTNLLSEDRYPVTNYFSFLFCFYFYFSNKHYVQKWYMIGNTITKWLYWSFKIFAAWELKESDVSILSLCPGHELLRSLPAVPRALQAAGGRGAEHQRRQYGRGGPCHQKQTLCRKCW